jgi:hypothetical protein
MRTKTLILSALLGALGSVAVHAQTNVYSLNAVGYINVTILPGYNIISCPLIASPDNTINTLLNNSTHIYNGDQVLTFDASTGTYIADQGSTRTTNVNGWANNGTNILAPGIGAWYYNSATTNKIITFVGTVPSGSLTNTLLPGYNLSASILPTSGDLCSNTLTTLTNYNIGDAVYVYSPTTGYADGTYASSHRGTVGYNGNWSAPAGDPTTPFVYSGFWYYNSSTTVDVNWVESYSVSQ